jgi:hypothetical protein
VGKMSRSAARNATKAEREIRCMGSFWRAF